MNRGIALLGLVVVRTATATRFLRGLAEANVTNYTRCVFQRVNKVECSDGGAMVDRKVTYGEELWSKDEAFALCDADPECDAVQKWKKNVGEGKSTRYKLCSLGKDACGRARHFDGDFIGFQFAKHFVGRHGITGFLEPSCHSGLGDGFAQSWNTYFDGHGLVPFNGQRLIDQGFLLCFVL